MTQVYLIRHGDSLETLVDGTHQELGLSPKGTSQMQLLQNRLIETQEIKADILFSSPLPRAYESAQTLVPALHLPVTQDDGLKEWMCDDGRLSDEEFNHRWQQVPEAQRPFTRWMDGYATWLEFSVQVQQTLNRLLQAHEGQTVVIVTHGGVIQASFVYFFGLNGMSIPGISLEKASITTWAKPGNKWILQGFNDTHHGSAV